MRRAIVKTVLAVIAVMIVLIGMVAVWQYDNIKALYMSRKYSQEDIRDKMTDAKKLAEEELKKRVNIKVTDITPEDEDKIRTGEMSMEEAAEKYNLPVDVMTSQEPDATLGNKDKPNASSGESGTDKNAPQTPGNSDAEVSVDDLVDEHVGLMYALKAKYVAALGKLEKQVRDDYAALSESERNASSKQKIASKYVDYVINLEESCDLEVEEVLKTLEDKLKECNGDSEIVQILRDAYKQEKELKKSYYLSLF